MTIEDILELKNVSDPQISPDGRWVAYVVSEMDLDENSSNSDIWIVSTEGGDPFRLTRGPKRDSSPRWSPDGSWLAFLSNRDEETQVYGIAPNGGEAWAVTDWKQGVGSFEIAPNGEWIAFTASAKKSEEDEELAKLRGEPIVWDSAYATSYSRLWVAPLDADAVAGEAVQSSPDSLHVGGFVWAPDSRGLAWDARPSPILRTFKYGAVYLQDEPGGAIQRVTEMRGGESVVEWTQHLGLIFAASGHELGTYNYQLWRLSENGEPVSLSAALDEHAGLVHAGEDRLLVEAAHRTGRRIYELPLRNGSPGGDPKALSDDRAFVRNFTASQDGKMLAFIGEDPSMSPDIYVTSTDRWRPKRLTDINPQVGDFQLGGHRVVTWPSRADGEEIEGVLTLPLGYSDGDRVPLLLVIHGGPSGVSSNRFSATRGAYPIQVFAGLGYAVLQPNYRGSAAYGERFRGLNRGDISGRDWIDIDLMGWSFGGHHTYWGITQTDRYAAASAGAGANDLVSMYSQTDIPEFYHTYLGPKPWEDFELYEERSAYRGVERVTTPLLIQVGERDERVPAEQSIQFYEAVKAIGKAPVKLILYPGEPHGIRQPRHRRDLMSRNVEWFTRWIPTGSEITRVDG
jgi:dipeptidyl aminopeptidase/acylaminoacyl peptidase